MPGRCVGPSRAGRAARRPWGKSWSTRMSRGWGARRRPRASVGETRCVSADKLRDGRRPWRGRPAAEAAAAGSGESEAAGTPETAGSMEAATEPGAVWVNGVLGEPEVVGPAGSVWVTRAGEEEPDDGSPRGCERKGRPRPLGHGSILELWLKVRAMRAASGCGEGSRVELLLGEGPVERGVPGRASWVETSRGGLTGPWVKGQARPLARAPGMPAAVGLAVGWERAPGSGTQGQAQAGRAPPPVGMPGAVETRSGMAPDLPGSKEIGRSGVAPGPWGRGQALGVPEAMAWPEAVRVPRTAEGDITCGGAPGLWGTGQSVPLPGALAQEAVCGDTPGSWGRGQAVGVPIAMEEQGSGGTLGLWGTGQTVVVPCATEEETRCGDDLGFRERERAEWVEAGSGGEPGWRRALHTAALTCADEQEAGSGGAHGPWGAEEAVGICRDLGREAGCASVPGLWGPRQQVAVSQAEVAPRAMGEETGCGGVPGRWGRQQALGGPVAEAVAGGAGEETCSGNVASLCSRRQAVGEQGALVPAALGVPGPVGQETGYRDGSCLCGRRQAVGVSELVGLPKAAGAPKPRAALAGVPTVMSVPGSGRVSAVWASGPVCQESSSRGVLSLWDRDLAVGVPRAAGGPEFLEELWPVGEASGNRVPLESRARGQAVGFPVAPELPELVGEGSGSGVTPRFGGRRLSARIPVATEVPTGPWAPSPLEVETGPGAGLGLLGRIQAAGVPAAVGVSPATGGPVAPRAPRPGLEEAGSGHVSGVWREREIARGPTRMGVPFSAGVFGPTGERTGSGGTSGWSGGQHTVGVGLPAPGGEETPSGGLVGRQAAEMPVAARVPMAVAVPPASGVSGPKVGDTSPGDGSGTWATETATATRVLGPVDGEAASEGVLGLWRRRHSGTALESVRVPQPPGMLAAVGVPVAGRVPAAVWVTGSPGGEVGSSVSGLTVGDRAAGEGTGGSSPLELAGRSQAVGASHVQGCVTRLWSCPRPVGQETAYENALGVSGMRTVVGVPPVSGEETGPGHFREHPQSGRGQAGGVSAVRVRGHGRGEDYVEEDRLGGIF